MWRVLSLAVLVALVLGACSIDSRVRFEGARCEADTVSPLEERVYAHVVGELLQRYRHVYVARWTRDYEPPGWWDGEAMFTPEGHVRDDFVPTKGDPRTPFGQAWNDLYRKMREKRRCIDLVPVDAAPTPGAKKAVKVEFSRVGFDSTRTLGFVEVTLIWSRVPTLGGRASDVRIVHLTPTGITSETYAQLFS